jgi:hypothetical protein
LTMKYILLIIIEKKELFHRNDWFCSPLIRS